VVVVGLSVGFTTGLGFPWFGFPGVGQDSIVLVTVLYSTLVFVLKTVTYETTGEGVAVGSRPYPLGPVPEGSITKLGPIELLELFEGGWALLKVRVTIKKSPRVEIIGHCSLVIMCLGDGGQEKSENGTEANHVCR